MRCRGEYRVVYVTPEFIDSGGCELFKQLHAKVGMFVLMKHIIHYLYNDAVIAFRQCQNTVILVMGRAHYKIYCSNKWSDSGLPQNVSSAPSLIKDLSQFFLLRPPVVPALCHFRHYNRTFCFLAVTECPSVSRESRLLIYTQTDGYMVVFTYLPTPNFHLRF